MSNLWEQHSPQNVGIRPIKGMMLNADPASIPRGSLLQASNLIVGPEGALRRPIWKRVSTEAVDYPSMQEVIQLWETDGTQAAVVLDSKFLYEYALAGGTFTGKYMTYSTGTVTVTGTAVVGSGTLWGTNDVQAGDIMVLDANGSGDGPEEVEIESRADETHLTLASTPVGTYGAGTDYSVRKAFNAAAPRMLDWVTADNKVVVVDGNRSPFSYDGTTFQALSASITIIPRCVGYFLDRLWFGSYISGATEYRQGIAWTSTTDHTALSGYTLQLPYVRGVLTRLVGLGPLLVAYFDDSVWFGTQTGYAGDTLPVAFKRVDQTGVGLLGPRALVPWMDGHFIVADDNIYFVSTQGMQPIGDPIVARTVRNTSSPWLVRTALDSARDRVVFGFPETGSQIQKLWSYNYKAKEWSYDEIPCQTIVSSAISESLSWGTYGGDPYAVGTASGTGTTVTGSGAQAFLTEVDVGATIFVDTDGDGTYETTYEVDSVTDDTHFETTEAISPAFSADPYYIVNPDDSWGSIPYESWSTFGAEPSGEHRFYLGKDGYLVQLYDDGLLDNDADPVTSILVTGDDDLGYADDEKTWLKFSFRIDRELEADLSAQLRISTNGGKTWKTIRTKTLTAGEREIGYTFKATGSRIRFELSLTGSVPVFRVSEMGCRVIGRGPEVSGR